MNLLVRLTVIQNEKQFFNDSKNSWEKRFKSFSDGYGDLKSGKKIEEYYYKDEFKKVLYKTVVDYIDNHLDHFVKKVNLHPLRQKTAGNSALAHMAG